MKLNLKVGNESVFLTTFSFHYFRTKILPEVLKKCSKEPAKDKKKMLKKLILFTLLTISLKPPQTEAVIEDILDILALTKDVIKTIAGTWEIVDQTGVANDIDLPFLKRKEQKIILRMAELSNEIKNTEMMVNNLDDRVMHVSLIGS